MAAFVVGVGLDTTLTRRLDFFEAAIHRTYELRESGCSEA